jgi:hypothetical protein
MLIAIDIVNTKKIFINFRIRTLATIQGSLVYRNEAPLPLGLGGPQDPPSETQQSGPQSKPSMVRFPTPSDTTSQLMDLGPLHPFRSLNLTQVLLTTSSDPKETPATCGSQRPGEAQWLEAG